MFQNLLEPSIVTNRGEAVHAVSTTWRWRCVRGAACCASALCLFAPAPPQRAAPSLPLPADVSAVARRRRVAELT